MIDVDSVILNLTERSCQAFQRLTGRTNVWLAFQLTNLSIIVYFAWAGVYVWQSGDVVLRIVVAVFCSGVLYALTQTIFKDSIEIHESHAYRRVARGFRNPRRLRDWLLRLSFLTLSLMLGYPVALVYVNLRVHLVVVTYALIILTTIVLYLLACDPLPPCRGRIREWLEGRQPVRAGPEPGRIAVGHERTIAKPSVRPREARHARQLAGNRQARARQEASRDLA